MANGSTDKGLIVAVVEEVLDRQRQRQRPSTLETIRVFITPVTIALVSGVVTWVIANGQNRNAERIAAAEIASAKQIADAQRERNVQIANAEQEIQRLSHINSIFKDIINPPLSTADDNSVLSSEIASLSVYKETALPFLLRIKQHYQGRDDQLVETASATIQSILTGSQLDFSGINFEDKSGRRILRYANFENYNLTDSIFKNVNLYNSRFNRSTLIRARFEDADLFGADFRNANLSNATFSGETNLRRANFSETKLDEIKFEKGVKNLEDAIFSFSVLLKFQDYGFLKPLTGQQLLSLLAAHRKALEDMDPNDSRLAPVLGKVGAENLDALKQALPEKR